MDFISSYQASTPRKVKLVEYSKPKFVTSVYIKKYKGKAVKEEWEVLQEKFLSDKMEVRGR
jgi:hypothetical protein